MRWTDVHTKPLWFLANPWAPCDHGRCNPKGCFCFGVETTGTEQHVISVFRSCTKSRFGQDIGMHQDSWFTGTIITTKNLGVAQQFARLLLYWYWMTQVSVCWEPSLECWNVHCSSCRLTSNESFNMFQQTGRISPVGFLKKHHWLPWVTTNSQLPGHLPGDPYLHPGLPGDLRGALWLLRETQPSLRRRCLGLWLEMGWVGRFGKK